MSDGLNQKEEVRKALEAVSRIQRRSAEGVVAFYVAPHFVIWGVVWTFAFLVSDLSVSMARMAWPVSVFMGNVAMWLLIYSQAKRRPVLSKTGREGLLFWVWILVALALFFLLSPDSGPRLLSYLCIIFVGIPCLLGGVWGRSAYVGLVGAGVTVISMIGILFAEQPYYNRWMALAGMLLLLSGWVGKLRWKVSHV